jgi:DNA-binding response OmpR family regulator
MVILLVEDEQKIAGFIKAGLEHRQYTVELAQDGEEALKRVSVNDYDLVILDLMLPKKDGYEVCRQMREMKLGTPVLMLTARDSQADKVRGLDIGADDYLVKPFELTELLARVRALLRREKAIKPQIISACDLQLDTLSHEVKRAGAVIELSNKEYRILEYLMRRAGSVCTRIMINEHIWGFNYLNSNAIDVHIKRLREKIDGGRQGKDKIIQTVYGRGYKIKS